MLPNPWQRGHAPNGLLKLNSRGSGSVPGRWQLCALIRAGEAACRALRSAASRSRGHLLKDHLAALAVGNLRRVHNARAVLGAHHNPVQKHKHRSVKVQVQQRLRRRKLEDPALLVEPVEAARRAARVSRAFSVSVCGESPPVTTGLRSSPPSRRVPPPSPPALRVRLSRRRRRHHRKQRLQPRSLAQRQHRLGNLVHRVALHQPVAIHAVHRPAARIEQPHVVVDLGRRSHRGARIPRGIFLLDRNRRRQPVDQVHVRLFNPLQKLPRIRRQRLHIPPLSLRINRVEGQRRLPRPRYPADHRQLPVRNLAAEVLQVVGPRAADDDGVSQREIPKGRSTGDPREKRRQDSFRRAPDPSASPRAQTSILHYSVPRAAVFLRRCAVSSSRINATKKGGSPAQALPHFISPQDETFPCGPASEFIHSA